MIQEHPDAYDQFATEARRSGGELTAASPGTVAVRALETLGAEGLGPSAPGAGRAPLSRGTILTARRQAECVAEPLDPDVEEGYDVPAGDIESCETPDPSGDTQQSPELPMDGGSILDERLRDADCDHVVADGNSGTDQVGSLLGEGPTHVIELLAPDGGTR